MSATRKISESSNQSKDKQNNMPTTSKQTVWELNEPIDVDAYQPSTKQNMLPVISKVESVVVKLPESSENATKLSKAITHVCNLLGLNSNKSLGDIKKELDFKVSFEIHKKNGSDSKLPDLDSDLAKACKSIFVSQLPHWFKHIHVKALIQLKTSFDVDSDCYYIEMFSNPESTNTSDCLMRFADNQHCLQVYEELQGLHLLPRPIAVNLDLGHETADMKDRNPNFEEGLRKYKEICLQQSDNGHSQQVQEKVTNNARAENKKESSDDDEVVFIEPDMSRNIVVKIEKTDDLITSKCQNEEQGQKETDTKPKMPENSNAVHETEDIVNSSRQATNHDHDFLNSKIVHFSNLGKNINSKLCRELFREWIKGALGFLPQFSLRNVVDENKQPTGHVLLEFYTPRMARKVVKNLNGYNYKGNHLEVAVGVGYVMKPEVTLQDLKDFERNVDLKRRSEQLENNQAAKRARTHSPSTLVDPESCIIPAEERVYYEELGLTKDFIVRNKLSKFQPYSRTVIVKRFSTRNFEKLGARTIYGYISGYRRNNGSVNRSAEGVDGLTPSLTSPISSGVSSPRSSISSSQEFDLHTKVSKAKVLEIFSLAGDVKKVELSIDQNCGEYKKAVIDFDHPLEAVQAISMFHDQKLYDLEMDVRMEEVKPKPLPEGLSTIGPGLGFDGGPMRGLRNHADLQIYHEMFTELGYMEEIANVNKPFRLSYKRLEPKYRPNQKYHQDHSSRNLKPAHNSSKNAKPKPVINNYTNSKEIINYSERTKNTDHDIQTLGRMLVSQGLIPSTTNCKSVESILSALQKKAATQGNRVANENAGRNQSSSGNVDLNQSKALSDAVDNVMQFFPLIMENVESPDLAIQYTSQNVRNPENGMPQQRGSLNQTQAFPQRAPLLPSPRFMPDPHWAIPASSKPYPLMSTPVPPPRFLDPRIQQMMQRQQLSNQIPQYYAQRPQTNNEQMPLLEDPVEVPSVNNNNPLAWRLDGTAERHNSFFKSEMLVFSDLPPSVNTNVLTYKMSEIGELKFCEMAAPGRAFVRFQQLADAERCIRLFHHSKVDGQVIKVGFL